MEDNGDFKEICTITGNEILTPKAEPVPVSKDEIVFRGKVRGRLSSLSLVLGIVCILITQIYFIAVIMTLMSVVTPNSGIPEFVPYMMIALPIFSPIMGVILLVLRHTWVRQLKAKCPRDKTRTSLKIAIWIGGFVALLPVILIAAVIFFYIIVLLAFPFMGLYDMIVNR